jgi:hypothetical protein
LGDVGDVFDVRTEFDFPINDFWHETVVIAFVDRPFLLMRTA